jgi:ketosteroid isomerase-like protein
LNKLVQEPSNFPKVFDHALNTRNLQQLLSLYDPEATIRTADNRTEQGHAAIREEMEKLIACQAELVNKTRHTFQSGDTALLIVDWDLSLLTPGGQRIKQSGTATNVLKNDPHLGWRMVMANPQGTA